MVILYDLFIPRQAWKIGFIVFFLYSRKQNREVKVTRQPAGGPRELTVSMLSSQSPALHLQMDTQS